MHQKFFFFFLRYQPHFGSDVQIISRRRAVTETEASVCNTGNICRKSEFLSPGEFPTHPRSPPSLVVGPWIKHQSTQERKGPTAINNSALWEGKGGCSDRKRAGHPITHTHAVKADSFVHKMGDVVRGYWFPPAICLVRGFGKRALALPPSGSPHICLHGSGGQKRDMEQKAGHK